MRRFGGRARWVVFLGAVIAVAAFGISSSAAKSGPSRVVAPVQQFNAHCGVPTTKKFIGRAVFISDKGVLTVRMKLHGALPGKYNLELWKATGSPFVCSFIAKLDTFKVDASGDGEGVGAIAVSGQSFFATANNLTGPYNDSLIVKVGGLL